MTEDRKSFTKFVIGCSLFWFALIILDAIINY